MAITCIQRLQLSKNLEWNLLKIKMRKLKWKVIDRIVVMIGGGDAIACI